jgi:hypothetical protein
VSARTRAGLIEIWEPRVGRAAALKRWHAIVVGRVFIAVLALALGLLLLIGFGVVSRSIWPTGILCALILGDLLLFAVFSRVVDRAARAAVLSLGAMTVPKRPRLNLPPTDERRFATWRDTRCSESGVESVGQERSKPRHRLWLPFEVFGFFVGSCGYCLGHSRAHRPCGAHGGVGCACAGLGHPGLLGLRAVPLAHLRDQLPTRRAPSDP